MTAGRRQDHDAAASSRAADGPVAWLVRPAVASDRPAWTRLYRAYATSAGHRLDDAHLARVWSWVLDPGSSTSCLLLHAGSGAAPVGLAHHRTFERPLAGSMGCYLDDLWVEETYRGRGGARRVLEELAALAAERGWSTVRWTTGETNPARHLYDQVAQRGPVITYDMAPTQPGGAGPARGMPSSPTCDRTDPGGAPHP